MTNSDPRFSAGSESESNPGGCACTSIDRSHCREPNCTFTPYRAAPAENESAPGEYIEFFSAPLIALVLTPFIVALILWSVKP